MFYSFYDNIKRIPTHLDVGTLFLYFQRKDNFLSDMCQALFVFYNKFKRIIL